MGGVCANTSCGQAYEEYKAQKVMNKKGIYTPNQIEDEIKSCWKRVAGSDETVDREKAKEIVSRVINGLGVKGNGITFDEPAFNKQYKKVDPMGLGKNFPVAL